MDAVAREPGRPCEFDGATEKNLAELVDVVVKWGYPLGGFEIKMMVKNFLNTKGEVLAVVPNNKPGDRWLKVFATRCQMSARAASNIRRARAMISQDVVNEFLTSLLRALTTPPPGEDF